MNLAKTVVDGIEFYVSPAGETGMSIQGLAVACGVAHNALRYLLKTPGNKLSEKAVKYLQGGGLDLANGKATFIPSFICAEIIEYYAFESKAKGYQAVQVYRKFAKLGIDTWIREMCGVTAQDNNQLVGMLQSILGKMDVLQADVEELKGEKRVMAEVNPGMIIVNEWAKKAPELPPAQQWVTAGEWLDMQGITLTRSEKSIFTQIAADSYKSHKQKFPRKVQRVYRYHYSELGELKAAYRLFELKVINQ